MTDSLEERLARLERERQEADRRYNDALTALDGALSHATEWPSAPPPYDRSRLAELNTSWNILPSGAPAASPSLKGRLRGFIWRLVGPSFETQRLFNSALVDHLNRNVAAHEQWRAYTEHLSATVRDETASLRNFQGVLLQYLQAITWYVDTKDRAIGGQADIVNAGLSAVADDWLKRWESLAARDARLLQRLAAIDDVRATATIAQQTSLALKREVERLLGTAEGAAGVSPTVTPPAGDPPSPHRAAPDLNAFKYLSFEDAFRGSADEIRRRLTEYVPLFAGASDVLDLGCGRGEFLELLRAAGVHARGLDTNHAMVEACRERGLDVVEADALDYLRSLEDASLGGFFATQVVEHLPPDYLMALLETAAHKLRPGSVMLLETINPACWLAFFESYIRDLTHVRPLHPETLQHLLRVSGFQNVRVEFKSPVAESERLDSVAPPGADAPPVLADLIDTVNEHAAKLNARLFTFQDYAAIGVKG